MSREQDTYQPSLEGFPSPEKEDHVIFAQGTTVFLESGGRGDLRSGLEAKKLTKKIKGLTGYEAVGRMDLAYTMWKTRYWSMPPGTRFGTWSKNAHPIKK